MDSNQPAAGSWLHCVVAATRLADLFGAVAACDGGER